MTPEDVTLRRKWIIWAHRQVIYNPTIANTRSCRWHGPRWPEIADTAGPQTCEGQGVALSNRPPPSWLRRLIYNLILRDRAACYNFPSDTRPDTYYLPFYFYNCAMFWGKPKQYLSNQTILIIPSRDRQYRGHTKRTPAAAAFVGLHASSQPNFSRCRLCHPSRESRCPMRFHAYSARIYCRLWSKWRLSLEIGPIDWAWSQNATARRG